MVLRVARELNRKDLNKLDGASFKQSRNRARLREGHSQRFHLSPMERGGEGRMIPTE